MDEIIRGLCATRGFVFRHELLAAGLQDRHIRLAQRRGLLTRLRHGTYAPAELVRAMTPEEHHLLLARSVLAKLGDGVALSHHSAAIAHTGVSFGVDLSVVHVTRLDGRGGRREAGIDHHVGSVVPDSDLCMVDGLQVVIPTRAVIESCSVASIESGMVTSSFALRRGACTHDELVEQMARHQRWPGMLTVRLAVQRAEPRCESVGEVRSLYLFAEFGIERPETQVVIADDDGEFARTDFGWRAAGHVGEFDGLVKYGRLNPEDGDRVGEVLVFEKRREDRIRDLDLGVSRWTTFELGRRERKKTAARIAAALERSRRRRRAS
jgi:hypothetical protein